METKITKQTKKLKTRQKEIIDYLLKFRHLQQTQIQQLLNHKSHERVRTWLNDLVERKYIFRIYERQIGGKPSEYCLDIGSISYLKEKGVDEGLINKIYDEKTHSQEFRDHCIFLGTAYLSLCVLTKKTNISLSFYTKTDLYNFKYLILPHPDCYFAIKENYRKIKRYFLDIFDDESFVYRRFYQYQNYYKKKYWQKNAKKPFPEIIFVYPKESLKQKAHKFINRKRGNNYPDFYLTTLQQVQEKGLCKEILTKVMEE